jgi:hypothetical protein
MAYHQHTPDIKAEDIMMRAQVFEFAVKFVQLGLDYVINPETLKEINMNEKQAKQVFLKMVHKEIYKDEMKDFS